MGKFLLLLPVAALAGCHGSINSDIEVGRGEEWSSGARSINGSIVVEDDAGVGGALYSINGRIEVGENANVATIRTINGSVIVGNGSRTGTINTVNGDVRFGAAVVVDGDVELVNGGVECERGCRVFGDVGSVNGQIQLADADIGGDVIIYNGRIAIDDSTVAGSVQVKKPNGSFDNRRLPRVVIGPNTRVRGEMRFERPVELFIHETAETGAITGADPVTFSGDRPDT